MLTQPLTTGDAVHRAVAAGRETLLDLQYPDGRWQGIVRCDPGVTAQFLLAARYVDRLDPARDAALLAHLEDTQDAGGGWPAYPGGPASLDVSLLCYAALRFAGRHPDSPPMQRARRVILAGGGLEAVGFVPRFPLVFWEQVPPAGLTYLSPKLLFLPRWIHPHVLDLGVFASPLIAIELLLKQRAIRIPPPGHTLGELRSGRTPPHAAMRAMGRIMAAASRLVDLLIPARGLDRRAADWLAGRQNRSGLWAEMVLFTTRALMALHATDQARYRGAVDAAMAGMVRLQVGDGRTLWQQVGRSPVLDTAIAAAALSDAGVGAGDARMVRAWQWLVATRTTGGWSLSPENAVSPDNDTTLHVLEALTSAPPTVAGVSEAIEAGTVWLLAMQDPSGGWAMWAPGPRIRRTPVWELEHNGAVDTSTPDVTARVVRALMRLRAHVTAQTCRRIDAAVARAVVYLQQSQHPNGSWPGRWAVNFAYGTAQGLTALTLTGDRPDCALRAREFLRSTQQHDGGWGESPVSYDARYFVPGPSTVTQTSLAMLGLLASQPSPDAVLTRGTGFLLDRHHNGGWDDETFTQTVLPGKLHCQNSLLAHSLAVMTLGQIAGMAVGRT
ncbi:MAG: hypothetical protein ACRDFT_03670 [bacterium]